MKAVRYLFLMVLFTCMLILSGTVMAKAVNWSGGEIVAEGFGASGKVMSPVQARIIARRAAISDAHRNLSEYVGELHINAKTTVLGTVGKRKMSAIMHGAMIAAEADNYDGSYKVTMKLPLYGVNSLAAMVVPVHETRKAFPEPLGIMQDMPADITTLPEARGDYTGIVIDCRAFVVAPVLLPAVYDENKRLIYNYEMLDPHKVINMGMAVYESDVADYKRAGSNPLFVKVVMLQDRGSNPVISKEAADFILAENKKSGFLDELAVVIVI